MIEANPFPGSMAWNNSGCPIWEVSVEKKFTLCPVRRGERNSTTFRTCRICLEDQPLTLYTIFDGKGTIFVNLHRKREQCTTFTCFATVVLNWLRASEVPIIKGPVKLLLFACKRKVSIDWHLTR